MIITHHATVSKKPVQVTSENVTLFGDYAMPESAKGVVIFAHGSGSGRHSPRNQFVAEELQHAGLGTLLLDLLNEEEAIDRSNVFDVSLLADRVLMAVNWVAAQTVHSRPAIGLFGASTGAAAALIAAARKPRAIKAVVSRGGRPDLAHRYLSMVTAPTLLIVGGYDTACIALNEDAYDQLQCKKNFKIVPNATHLFPEPGTLEDVARLASDWYSQHLLATEP